MIHKRTYRIENIDKLIYYKTIVVNVGLDRMKEWELTIKEFGIKVNNNKINSAKKEIKKQLLQLHQDYLEDKLEDSLKVIYAEYMKPYFGRSQTPQSENVRRMREEHNEMKAKVEQEKKDNTL